MSAELKSRFRTGAKICSGVIIILLLVAALGPAKWAPRTELGWQFDHFIGCIAWPRPVVVGGIVMAVAALLESLQALTPDRSANLEAALWGAGGALAAALVAELFIQRHLVAVLTAVAAALAWQSYGDAAKQVKTGSPCRTFPRPGPRKDPNPPLELLSVARRSCRSNCA